MKFNFKIQQYQTDAVNAVVNVFSGQSYRKTSHYIRDLGTLEKPTVAQLSFDYENDLESSRLRSYMMGYFTMMMEMTHMMI